MGFLDKLLGREKKPTQEAPAASVAEPPPPAHDHEHGEHDHSHDEGGQAEEQPPA